MNTKDTQSLRLFAAIPLLLAALLLASSPAQAERIQGRFTFKDSGDSGIDRPIPGTKVEIWRSAPRFLGIWTWANDRTAWTDENGWIDVDMPWVAHGVEYELRVYASNGHVTVWPQDTPHVGESFYRNTPKQKVYSSGAVLDFTYNFTEIEAARNYNIAAAGWYAGEYLRQVYGALPRAHAQTTIYENTFYEPVGNTLQIYWEGAFDDSTVIHEYAHFVQEQIGSLPWEPSKHSLCTVTDPVIAWMEGHANFFEAAVKRYFPGAPLKGSFYNHEDIFSVGDCSTKYPRDSVEGFIAATLWDLVDSANEPHDLVGGMDWYVLSIIDAELGDFGARPTIWDFRNAWHGRGLNGLDLDRIYAAHDLLPHFQISQLISQSVPTSMIAGRQYAVQVTMKNLGSTLWSAASGHRLGSQSPQDNLTWGFHRVDVPGSVAPGQQATFSFTVTAPSTPGSYTFQWKMVQDGVGWFGDATPAVQVAVTAGLQSAQYVSQSVPGTMNVGETHAVSVTLRNNGDTTWYPGTHFLGSQNPQDNFNWGLNRVALPAAVPPGGQVTFYFNATAPSWGGSYGFQWRMLQNGIGWFGDSTPNVFVSVKAPAPTCSSTACSNECIASGCRGGSCMGGECFCMRCL